MYTTCIPLIPWKTPILGWFIYTTYTILYHEKMVMTCDDWWWQEEANGWHMLAEIYAAEGASRHQFDPSRGVLEIWG